MGSQKGNVFCGNDPHQSIDILYNGSIYLVISEDTMNNNIIYQIDKNKKRVNNINWNGDFENSIEDSLWIKVLDENGEDVDLCKGDMIHYSHCDLPICGDYEVLESNNGIYRVKKM